MQIVKSTAELRQQVRQWRHQGLIVGFVPTMGNLHQGHLSLVEKAKQKADKVIVSIFVNPMQFAPGEDLESYPRTLDQDCQQLDQYQTDLVFCPPLEEIYPCALEDQTRVAVPNITQHHCGSSRPVFFGGITTVVTKLFNLVQPDLAVFGEKDFQQLQVIRKMVHDLCMPIEIIGGELVRESDGLAMSSRNGYLNIHQRSLAPKLRQVLLEAAEKIRTGDVEFDQISEHAKCKLEQLGFKPDYFNIARRNDLEPAGATDKELVILAAAALGQTRLIDNEQIFLQ
ncbi:pantoate--beta-alanine ligase [Pelagibaculum spongiae]|uniref:Pantothenate synthetase n=1 Tax=Pelagibaculum spongiae TaxID=2080658 RepID=A0A2V1H503_9GAMM|nr:pantoate--beta-alanine ligase [Pelagibaculum spongiae]PVZ72308.1 pantoate--beta-alanine ligase [Pelagibaculum spongiae]